MGTRVTDPALLAQLNNDAPAEPRATPGTKVTDPAILAQLNGSTDEYRTEAPGFMARVGRGMMDIGQGAKQWLLQLGDKAQGTPEERAAAVAHGFDPDKLFPKQAAPQAPEYTAKVSDEIKRYEKDRGPNAGFDAARMLGQTAITAPLALATGGSSVPAMMAAGGATGAATGALDFDPTGNSRLTNAALGGTIGAVAPALGAGVKAVATGAKTTLTPTVQKAIQTAKDHGIPLDLVQQTGSKALEALRDTTAHFPFSGAAKKIRDQQDKFMQALGDTFGQPVPGGQLTPDVMKDAGSRIGAKFDALSTGKPVPISTKMNQAVQALEAKNNSMASTRSSEIADLVDSAKKDFSSRKMMSGEDAQLLRSEYTKSAREAYAAGKYKLSDAYKQLRNAVDDSIESTLAPDEKAAWDVAKKQYGNYKVVSKALAASGGETGDVSGTQLWNAVKSDVGRDNMARASGALPDLASLGKDVLKVKTPDSGTARRLLYQSLAMTTGAAAGGAAGEQTGHGTGTGAVIGLTAGALTSRTLRNQLIADMLKKGVAPSFLRNATTQQLATAMRQLGTSAATNAATQPNPGQ